MDNYLIIKDSTTMKAKRFNSAHSAIEPISCTISDSLGAGNDIEFTTRYQVSDELALGDWVEVPSTDGKVWGGLVFGKTIDKAKNTVTWKGVSARGMLGGVRVVNNGQAVWELYDPEGSKASEYSSGDKSHNMRKLLEFYNISWGLPIEFTESEYIPQQVFVDYGAPYTGYYVLAGVPDYTKTIIEWLNDYLNVCRQKSVMLTPSSSSNILRVDMRPSVLHKYLITDEPVIMSEGIGYNGYATTANLAYINDSGNVAYQRFLLSGYDPSPSDLTKKLLQRYTFGETSNHTSFNDLQLKNKLLDIVNVSPLETSVKINPEKLDADVGDTVELNDPDLNVTSKQAIIEKRLIISATNVNFEYITGDTAK